VATDEGDVGIPEQNVKDCLAKRFCHRLALSSPELFKGGFSAIVRIQPSFEDALQNLEESMPDSKQRFDTIVFTKELEKLRRTLHRQEKSRKERLPKTINPM